MPELTFSNALRKEREAKGISFKQIADHTMISSRYLKAIEEEKLQILPGGIFTTSFVQQYAQYLGIDQDESITEFLRSTTEARTRDKVTAQPRATAFSKMSYVLLEEPYRLMVAGILSVLAVAFIGLLFWKFSSGNEEVATASNQQYTMLTYPDAPAGKALLNAASFQQGLIPSASAESTLSTTDISYQTAIKAGLGAEQDGETSDNIDLNIETIGTVWLSIIADGTEWNGIMEPNQTKQINASETIRVTIGDAGAVALNFNGEYLPTIGQPGEVKYLVFTPEGPDPAL